MNILPEWLAERQWTLETTVMIAAFTLGALEFGADYLQTVLSEREPQLHVGVLTKTHHYILYIHELKINQ